MSLIPCARVRWREAATRCTFEGAAGAGTAGNLRLIRAPWLCLTETQLRIIGQPSQRLRTGLSERLWWQPTRVA